MSGSSSSRVAVVTGAASGIGKAIAEKFASEGVQLGLIDVNEANLSQVVADLSQRHSVKVEAFVADLSDRAQCYDVVDRVFQWATPNHWVNNAGILRLATAEDTPDDLFDTVMNTNFRSTFVLSTRFAKKLLELGQTGSIVNISSIHALLSEPNAAVYTAAKGAIEAASRTFASEWASRGIRVNCVRPGATYTELTVPIYSEQITAAIYSRVPMRRIAEAREIAEGVYFLASDSASYITGTTLDIDGGYIMDGSLPEIAYT